MWPEASHFALQLLRRLGSWILNNSEKLFKRLFSRQQKLKVSFTRERTVTVRDKLELEVTADFASSSPHGLRLDGEKVKQLVKSLLDAEQPDM